MGCKEETPNPQAAGRRSRGGLPHRQPTSWHALLSSAQERTGDGKQQEPSLQARVLEECRGLPPRKAGSWDGEGHPGEPASGEGSPWEPMVSPLGAADLCAPRHTQDPSLGTLCVEDGVGGKDRVEGSK